MNYFAVKTSFLVVLWNVILPFIQAQEHPLHLTVYYEALCPDSRSFVTRTLRSTLLKFPNLDIKYIPFGKANSNGYGGFECQHGPEECKGNIVQACALARLEPGKAQHDFVYCAMLYPKQYEKCITKSGLSWVDVESCSVGPEGFEYHRSYEVQTKGNTDGPTFVPSISVNNVFDKSESTSAFNDLESFLCSDYFQSHPQCVQQTHLLFGK